MQSRENNDPSSSEHPVSNADRFTASGLKNVYADTTEISFIDLENRQLSFRGTDVTELNQYPLQYTVHLLLKKTHPGLKPMHDFYAELLKGYQLESDELALVRKLPLPLTCMEFFELALPQLKLRRAPLKDIHLIGKMAALASYYHHRIQGTSPHWQINPLKSLEENFFHLFVDRPPSPPELLCFRACCLSYLEHGFNASTFVARIVASTKNESLSAVTAAVSTLKGDYHGGAIRKIYPMLEVLENEDWQTWLNKELAAGRRIMGFGHRVYRHMEDVRSTLVWPLLKRVCLEHQAQDLLNKLEELKNAMAEKGLYPNVDFAVAPALYLMGFPAYLADSFIAMNRVVGWLCHIEEQETSRTLIRPRALYVGPLPKKHT